MGASLQAEGQAGLEAFQKSPGWLHDLLNLNGARGTHLYRAEQPGKASLAGQYEFSGYLRAVENTRCSDRKDKIFSLRAFLDSISMRNSIRVDYKISVPDLCANALKAAMMSCDHDEHQKNIDICKHLSFQLCVSLQLNVVEILQPVDLLLDDSEGPNAPALDVVDYIFWYGDLTEAFFKITYVPLDREWSWKRKKEYLVSWRDKARHTEWPPPVPSPGSA